MTLAEASGISTTLMRDEIDAIRNISIHSILELPLGRARIAMRCIFHSDNSPSLVIYRDNSYHCYGCGAHGKGAIDFAVQVNGGNPKTATPRELKKAIDDLKSYL